MFAVEVYAAVRHFVMIEKNSQRDAARVFGLSRETVSKMCRFSAPPGYTRVKPVAKPKLPVFCQAHQCWEAIEVTVSQRMRQADEPGGRWCYIMAMDFLVL